MGTGSDQPARKNLTARVGDWKGQELIQMAFQKTIPKVEIIPVFWMLFVISLPGLPHDPLPFQYA